jgi:hypothetical protein
MSEINIRSKPTKVPLNNQNKEKDLMPPSPELINEDLRAAVVQMDSIESVPPSKFKVKDPPPRSPAPLPEAISPAGVPIDLKSPETRDLEIGSPKSAKTDFKIDLTGLDEVDVTVEGRKPEEYKRNVKGSLVVIGLLLVSLHLFLNHLTMFTWVVNFDSPELVIAAVLYIISTILILVMFLGVLAVPSLSINDDKLVIYYSPIVVAGMIDLIAVWMGGGIFSPLSIYTLDSMNYLYYNEVAVFMTLLINGLLYYSFARKEGAISSLVHPFERIKDGDEELEDDNLEDDAEESSGTVEKIKSNESV